MDIVQDNLKTITDIIPVNYESQQRLCLCSLIAITFVSYSIGYNFLRKFAKAYILNEAVPKINQFRLVNALWRVLFSLWTIGLFVFSVWDPSKNKFNNVFSQATIPQCNATDLAGTEEGVNLKFPLLIAPVSFFLHQLYISILCFTKPAVLSMGSLCLFVFSANYLQCPYLCLQILFFLALNVGTLELARTIYALKSRYKGYEGPRAPTIYNLLALPFFIFHLLVWMVINLYLFPLLYFSLPSVTEVGSSVQSASAYINLFLAFYAKKQFFDSAAWSLLKLLVRKPSEMGKSLGRQCFPVIVLLPYLSPLLPELRTIQMKLLLDAIPTSAERRMIRKKLLSAGGQTSAPISEGKADLMSVVGCVKMLKRKMRHRYEQKMASEVSRAGSTQIETEIQEDSNDVIARQPDDSDVTDIFIPVPHQNETPNSNRDSEESVSSTSRDLEVTADVHTSAEDIDLKTDLSEDERLNEEHQPEIEQSED